jgi:hypothetical protein
MKRKILLKNASLLFAIFVSLSIPEKLLHFGSNWIKKLN